MTLHHYKIFTWHSVPVAHNFTIRHKHWRRIRTFKQQSEESVQCRKSDTERTVLWMVHRLIRGAPWRFIDSKSAILYPRSPKVLWKVKTKKTGTVNFCSQFSHLFFKCQIQTPKQNNLSAVAAAATLNSPELSTLFEISRWSVHCCCSTAATLTL